MTTVNKIRVNFVRRTIPRRGPFSTEYYNASMEELAVDLADFGTRWNTELYPILNSLPRGSDETRWSGATNVPDPIADGLDGDHMFVDNAASTTQDDGLFWSTTELRPKTIRESERDLDTRMTSIYSELSETILGISNGLSQDQWNRLGAWVKDGTASLTTSVSYKARTGWDKLHQLILDVFELDTSLGVLGSSGFTIEEMLTNLLTIHGGIWNTDTSSIDHGSITGVTQQSVDASSTYIKRARGYSPDANNLEEDLNRLRYEIARTRWGTATTETTGQWNADITDPVGGGVACLNVHMGYTGNGTQDANNPHGLHRQDIDGLDTEFGYNNSFIGKGALGSEMPTYSSISVVTQNASLEATIGELDLEASRINSFIGKTVGADSPSYSSSVYVSGDLEVAVGLLDAALNAHEIDVANPHTVTALQTGAAIREVYSFSSHTDINAPIIINHGKGTADIPDSTFPLIQVVDTGVGGDYGVLADEVYIYEQEHGIVTSDAFISIEYIDANTFHVYTNVVDGVIIAVF